MRSINDVVQITKSQPEAGLAASAVAALRAQFGRNALTPIAKEPLWKKFLEKFDEPIIKILLAAALLSMIVETFNAGTKADAAEKSGLFLTAGLSLGWLAVSVTAFSFLSLGRWIPSLLFGSAVLIFLVGLASCHPSYEGLAVMVAVILATGVSFAAEYKSDSEFEALNAQKDSVQVKVIRDGTLHTVPLEEVVVGDLVSLEMGDEIPADGRVLRSADLKVDQSLMTGESEPVRKKLTTREDTTSGPSEISCLYRATQVVEGAGQMLVTEVGDATYVGQIARKLTDSDGGDEDEAGDSGDAKASYKADAKPNDKASDKADAKPDDHADKAAEKEDERVRRKLTVNKALTPLQLKLTALAQTISSVGYVAAGLIFLALTVLGVVKGDIYVPADAEQAVIVGGELLKYFMYMVIVIVVAVPEGLPMSVTVSLALAMQKMTRANSLVRQLVACETIGSATVIASDKTGTLTQNKMTVVRIGVDGKVGELGGADWLKPDASAAWPRDGKPVNWLALNSAANSTAHLEEKDGKITTVGNSTEGSLLGWLRDAGLGYNDLREQFPPLYQLHFSSERKRMTTVIRYGSRLVTLVKGAPEIVLDRCQKLATADGGIRELSDADRASIREQLKDAASQAMRTLGFAFAELPADFPAEPDPLHERKDELEKELVFNGFVAIRDPLREDVPDAVRKCRAAGIEVKMVTGDNLETARAIGRNIGLLDRSDAVVLTGPEFQAKSDAELLELLPRMTILSRAQPLDKYRLVTLLQRQDHVVAVTGDGTNDAPALKKADVGLSMGKAGTEVAKEASKIVLLDDSFATIVRAVHWGRALYENIQRFIQFQLTINVSALSIAFLGPFIGVKPPFTVLQLLWINVIMDTFASIALCSEPPRDGLMTVPAKKKDENILSPSMKGTILTTAAFFVVVMLALLVAMERPLVAGNNWLLNLLGRPEGFGLFAGTTDSPRTEVFPELNYRQATIFFTVYVLFQMWNQINCRSLVPQESGLRNLFGNPTFLAIASLTLIGQLLIVNFGGSVFQVEPLSVIDWLVITAATSSVLVFAEAMRFFRSGGGPSESAPSESAPTPAKPSESKPSESKPSDSKPSESQKPPTATPTAAATASSGS